MADKLVSVKCPKELEPVFLNAEKMVKEFFSKESHDPAKAVRRVSGDRYMLVRAEALGYHIRKTAEQIVGPEGAKMFIYQFGKAIGKAEAKGFHEKFKLKAPDEKLAPGPVHFNYAGFAFVDLLPESHTSPDDNYLLLYNHPHSFEAEMQLKHEGKTKHCVCYLNAGYSAGWCSESFGIELDAREVICVAKGDPDCRFVMAPPFKLPAYVEEYSKLWRQK